VYSAVVSPDRTGPDRLIDRTAAPPDDGLPSVPVEEKSAGEVALGLHQVLGRDSNRPGY